MGMVMSLFTSGSSPKIECKWEDQVRLGKRKLDFITPHCESPSFKRPSARSESNMSEGTSVETPKYPLSTTDCERCSNPINEEVYVSTDVITGPHVQCKFESSSVEDDTTCEIKHIIGIEVSNGHDREYIYDWDLPDRYVVYRHLDIWHKVNRTLGRRLKHLCNPQGPIGTVALADDHLTVNGIRICKPCAWDLLYGRFGAVTEGEKVLWEYVVGIPSMR
jgi:hypothetical protein